LRTDDKPSHLIERAAARMVVPWGEVLARRAPPAATLATPDGQGAVRLRPVEPPVADKPAKPSIATDALARAGLIDRTQRRARIAEEFRIVQSKVLREAFGGNGIAAIGRSNLILVTSALQGEGKSFVALNLAAGIARQGDRRALLIDADVKRNSLGHLVGVSAEPGLLDLIRSGGNSEELLLPTALPNLDILPIGTGIEESSELLPSKRMAELLEDLSRRYADRPVIFDAPPCLSSSNPHVLAPLVGQVILVVAAGTTHQGDIEAALELVQNCRSVSLLLNKIAPWNLHSFGSYSYPLSSA
jgi:protein-tyrosine kinase